MWNAVQDTETFCIRWIRSGCPLPCHCHLMCVFLWFSWREIVGWMTEREDVLIRDEKRCNMWNLCLFMPTNGDLWYTVQLLPMDSNGGLSCWCFANKWRSETIPNRRNCLLMDFEERSEEAINISVNRREISVGLLSCLIVFLRGDWLSLCQRVSPPLPSQSIWSINGKLLHGLRIDREWEEWFWSFACLIEEFKREEL